MRTGVELRLGPGDRDRLEAIVASRNSPQKHVWRARIVLLSADGIGTMEIQRRTGKGKPTIWRWQERFMRAGVGRPASRCHAAEPEAASGARRYRARCRDDVERTAGRGDILDRPGDGQGCRGQSSQRATDLGGAWPEAAPHPNFQICRTIQNSPPRFKMSSASMSIRRSTPLVLSVDEKSQIQALDRTQPGLPMKRGRCGTMTHDCKRHGMTTLFAALNVLEGKVIGQCMARHRHQEFIRFLNHINRRTPADRDLHLVVDNYATHKHPNVLAWLERHPRFHFHFTRTSASWLNAVEGFFAKLIKQRLKRGVVKGIVDLQAAINRYLAEINDNPKPFSWSPIPTPSSIKSGVGNTR
jgi:transposase